MKKFFYPIFLALICWSCNNKGEVEAPYVYQEGQEVEIKVAARTQNINSVPVRGINGTWNETGAGSVQFVWEWSGNEQIKIVYQGKEAIFNQCEQKAGEAGIATFKGVMPTGWKEGETATVIAGDIEHEWPVSSMTVKTDGIGSNAMRFTGTMTSLSTQIELVAAWSAFRFPIYFHAKPSVGTLLDQTSVQVFTNTLALSAKCDGSDVNYEYTINALFPYTYQASSSAGSSYYPYYICVVKPGTYTDMSVTITFDLSKCKVYKFDTSTMTVTNYALTPSTQSAVKTFNANQGGTLEADNIYTPGILDCEYIYEIQP